MKFVRYLSINGVKPAVVESTGAIRDISSVTNDVDGDFLSSARFQDLLQLDIRKFPEIRRDSLLRPPIATPEKIIGIGLNYRDHAAESGLDLPKEPVVFLKAPSSICGPFDPIALPVGAQTVDWEVELGIVIAKRTKSIDASQAMKHIAGFCVTNDISERTHQLKREGQWTKGKSADTFSPLGPYLVTLDEIFDHHNMDIWLSLDGVIKQHGNTADMIFDVAAIVSCVSRYMTLMPGDLIMTGTPAGIGATRDPPEYLREGQTLRFGIEGLGEQSHTITHTVESQLEKGR